MKALISDCGQYRYVLWRKIPQILRWVKPVVFVMLNPSTADGTEDDPTLRRCIGFAKQAGYTDLTVVNLFALRATHPTELKPHPDPVGPLNNHHIEDQLYKNRLGDVVIAWGGHAQAKERARWFLETYRESLEGRLFCLGTTMHAPHAPLHPLYLRKTTQLVPYPGVRL